MALAVLITPPGGSEADRTNPETRINTIDISLPVEYSGTMTIDAQSPDGSWRPDQYAAIEVWEPMTALGATVTISGSTTVTCATAAWTAADEGADLRLRAGASSVMRRVIVTVVDPTTIEVDEAATASFTWTGANLYGVCRFLGALIGIQETRLRDAPGTSLFRLTAEHCGACLLTTRPIIARSAETLRDRVIALTSVPALTAVNLYGVRVYWPETPLVNDTIDDETGATLLDEAGADVVEEDYSGAGGMLAAQTYDGTLTLLDALRAAVDEDGSGRQIAVSPAGLLQVVRASQRVYGTAITDAAIRAGAGTTRGRSGFRNVQVVEYANGSVYETDYTHYNTRVYAARDSATTLQTSAEASAYALSLLDRYSDPNTYRVTLDTTCDGVQPGMLATITSTDLGVSGTHLVESVASRYVDGGAAPHWLHRIAASNREIKLTAPQDYFDRVAEVI